MRGAPPRNFPSPAPLPPCKRRWPNARWQLRRSARPEARLPIALRLRFELALQPADVLLGVEIESDALDQMQLSFEEVDVVFLILHQALEQIARNIVLHAMAVGCALFIERAGPHFRGEIALDDFLDVLADPQGIQHLHVGKSVRSEERSVGQEG